MFAKLKSWFQRPVVQFIALTVFYFAVMLALVYLYGYSGINQAKFIYNEFLNGCSNTIVWGEF